jgi:hypothetical protein
VEICVNNIEFEANVSPGNDFLIFADGFQVKESLNVFGNCELFQNCVELQVNIFKVDSLTKTAVLPRK